MNKRSAITKAAKGQMDSPLKSERLRTRIAANERLLSLYDSPFPDRFEKCRRAELIADINEAQRQLDEITSVRKSIVL